MQIALPENVTEILDLFKKSGFKAYAVGGAVRDVLLGLNPPEWDLATSASLEQITALFPESRLIGEKYAVVRVLQGETEIDIASMRIDGCYSDHRRPDQVELTDRIEEDLARRDFTINGMAYSTEEGLIDPFDGQRDIKAHMLRAIGKSEDRFSEDPLRILRALRFSGQLGFDIALETFTSMQKTVFLLERISMDRRREEFDKLLTSKNAGKALRMCVSVGAMPFLLGEAYPPSGERAEANFSLLLQKIDLSSRDLRVRRTMLFYCVEKQKAISAAKTLGIDSESRKNLERDLSLLRELLLASDRYEIKAILSSCDREGVMDTVKLFQEYQIVFAGENSSTISRSKLLSEIAESGDPLFLEELALNGQDLLNEGFPQGKEVGELLDGLLKLVHKDPGMNERAKLLKTIKQTKPDRSERISLRERISGIAKNRRT